MLALRDPVRHLAALLAPAGPTASVPTTSDRWRPVLETASRHALLPALWSSLRESGAVETVPEGLARHWESDASDRVPVELALASSHRRNLDRVTSLCGQAVEILAALEASGVRAIALKGVDAVLSGRYRDPAARTMVDADILIDPGAAGVAEDLVHQLGYRAVAAPESTHQLAPMVRPGQAGSVELHRALTVERWAAVADPVAMLDRSEIAEGGRRQASRTDSALHLVAHAQLHDEGYLLWRLPLRAVHETSLMVSGREDIDWDEVARAFSRVGRRGALATHLELTSRLFDVPTPLAAGRVWGWRTRATVCLDHHPVTLRRLDDLVWLPRALSPARMAELYEATDRRSLRRARVGHVRRAVWRRVRGAPSGLAPGPSRSNGRGPAE